MFNIHCFHTKVWYYYRSWFFVPTNGACPSVPSPEMPPPPIFGTLVKAWSRFINIVHFNNWYADNWGVKISICPLNWTTWTLHQNGRPMAIMERPNIRNRTVSWKITLFDCIERTTYSAPLCPEMMKDAEGGHKEMNQTKMDNNSDLTRMDDSLSINSIFIKFLSHFGHSNIYQYYLWSFMLSHLLCSYLIYWPASWIFMSYFHLQTPLASWCWACLFPHRWVKLSLISEGTFFFTSTAVS